MRVAATTKAAAALRQVRVQESVQLRRHGRLRVGGAAHRQLVARPRRRRRRGAVDAVRARLAPVAQAVVRQAPRRKIWTPRARPSSTPSSSCCPSRTRCAAWRCARSRSRSTSSRRRTRRSPSICSSGELQKLDDLVRAFLELSVTCARYQDYLGSVDVDEIERDLRRYHQILDKGEGDKRALAQKNIAVLGEAQREVRARFAATCRRRAGSSSSSRTRSACSPIRSSRCARRRSCRGSSTICSTASKPSARPRARPTSCCKPSSADGTRRRRLIVFRT